MKVIKSPIIYEAELFHSKGNIPKGVKMDITPRGIQYYYIGENLIPPTYVLCDGDWIVKDPEGNLQRYSEKQFRETFEKVED